MHTQTRSQIRRCEAKNVVIQISKMHKQLSLSCSTPISTLIKDIKISRHPQIMKLSHKLEEVQHLLEAIYQADVSQSEKVKTAIYELKTKF